MKKRLLIIILVLVVAISGLSILYYTSYPIIGVTKMISTESDNFSEEFYGESINVNAVVSTFLPDSPMQTRKMDEVWMWNNDVALELTEYRKNGGKAYNIKVSGEIEDGKTTLRYEGYIVTKEGEKIDYKQEKTFDFVLCSDKNFF